MYKTAIYIGRFQPFHNGHLKTVQIALQKANQLIIAIGSSNRPRTIKNPWTELEREDQIKQVLHAEGIDLSKITFIHNRDYMYNDTHWVSEVYSHALLAGATDDKQTMLIGHFKDDSSYYLKMFPKWDLVTVPNFYNANSTDVRKNLFEWKENNVPVSQEMEKILGTWIMSPEYSTLKEEYDFIQKYKAQFASLPYPPIFVTVDTVVIKSGCVLMVKRKHNPGKGLWALPGGFINADEKIVKSAIRELKEETKIDIDKPVLERSIVDVKIFDHPYRSLRGRTITHAHLIDLGIGDLPSVKAADDAEMANWIPLSDFYKMEDKMFEDHWSIVYSMTSKF